MNKQTITTQQAVDEYRKAGLGDITIQTIKVWLYKKIIVGRKIAGRWHIDRNKFIAFLKVEDGQ